MLSYLLGSEGAAALPADPEGVPASLTLRAKGLSIPYDVFAVTVMPGEVLDLELVLPDPQKTVPGRRWTWVAPETPGVYPVDIPEEEAGRRIHLNVLVMHPFDHAGESLNGFRIGRYEERPLRGNPLYEPPAGFVEVTPDLVDLPVSSHFTLGQFLCKQDGGWPKYLQLREPVLLKLEMLLAALQERGIEAPTLHIMSAFRTPYYNRLIGNTTRYSRHLYGGAVDVFVDVDENGVMDDLNNDGRIDRRDAIVLAEMIGSLAGMPEYTPLVGGLATYGPKRDRGPFVHMDVRQVRARW